MTKYMAVQLPAFCPLNCDGCRTIEFNRKGYIPGDMEAVQKHLDTLQRGDFLFITSTGEPGYCDGYEEFVSTLINRGVEVGVCCSNKKSILPGMVRVEISRSEEQDKTSIFAIQKARKLGIPYIATVVNFGQYDEISLDKLKTQLDNPEGLIIRQAQPEGAASELLKNQKHSEETKTWQNEDSYLGKLFPAPCFSEFEKQRKQVNIICIDHLGRSVKWLGGDLEEEPESKVILQAV